MPYLEAFGTFLILYPITIAVLDFMIFIVDFKHLPGKQCLFIAVSLTAVIFGVMISGGFD